MQVSLESLAGRELVRASDGMKTLADVEQEAGEMAKQMIDEISRISILSPYTVEAVQNTFRLNTAFGYTFKEAERMTEGLLKLAAGVGADNEQLNRMAYNLAQVRLQGSVTKLDIRQLALAGIDLRDVLIKVSDQLGFQIEDHKEFNELIATGQITWEQFSVEFAKYADKYFGKSSEKMARTLLGLKSTFHDVFILTMPKIIGPSVDRITAMLGKLLDMFIRIRDTDMLEKLGVSFGRSIGKVLDPIDKLLDHLTQYADLWLTVQGFTQQDMGREAIDRSREALQRMKTPLEAIKDTIEDMFGPKIGGIINAFVDKVIAAVGRISEAWKAFAEGDIRGAFEALGTPDALINFVDDILKAVGNLQEFWDANGSDVLRILSELFEGLLDFGGDQLNTGMEETGGFFERLTQRIIDNGPKIVEKLEEAKDTILNEVLPAIDRFIERLVNEWIPAAIEFGEYLRNNWQPILQKIATVAGVLIAVFAGFAILKGVIGFVMGLVGAFSTLATSIAGFAALSAAAGGFAAVVSAAFPVLVVIVGAVAVIFTQLIAVVIGVVSAVRFAIKHWETITEVFQRVKDFLDGALGPAFKGLIDAFGPMQAALGELRTAFQPLIDALGPILIPILKVLAAIVGAVLVNALAVLTGVITAIVNVITSLVNTFTGVIRSFATIISGLANFIGGIINLIVGLVTGDTEKMSAALEQIWLGIKQFIGGIISAILTIIVGAFGAILSALAGFGSGFSSVWASVWSAVADKTTGKMKEIAQTISDNWNQILEITRGLGEKFAQAGAAIVEGIREGISNGWGSLVSWLQDKIKALIAAALGAAGISSRSKPMIYMGEMMVEGLKKGLQNLPGLLQDRLVAPIANVPNQVPSTAFDSHDTNHYAPVYQIYQQRGDRFSVQGVG
jgi:tape measure domain-containing protein